MATKQHILITSLSSRHVCKPKVQNLTNSALLLCSILRPATVKRWDPWTVLHHLCRYATSRTETALLDSPENLNGSRSIYLSFRSAHKEEYYKSAKHSSRLIYMLTGMLVSILAPRPTAQPCFVTLLFSVSLARLRFPAYFLHQFSRRAHFTLEVCRLIPC
jgi:hypothetical protein